MTDELVRHLRRMKDESRRSLREIERATHVSNSSLSRYLSGQSMPQWNVVVALCRVTGHDPRPLRPLWEDANRSRRGPGRPFGVERGAALRAPRNDLPRDAVAFTARHDEVAELLRLGRAGRTVAIDGMGGVGKTALAVHAAHLLAATYPDCQIYVDLHGFTPGREPMAPQDALSVLLRALDVPVGRIPDGPEERAALWRSELALRRAVVVLDNAVDGAHVRHLLPGAGANAILVTSRRRLVDVDGVEPLSLSALSDAEAAELFAASVGGGRGDDAAVAELVRRCGRLPLAIRVAAARLRHRSRWGITDLLEWSTAEDVGVRQVVDTSLVRLGPAQRRMFQLLGAVPGGDIEPYAAAALADLPLPQARKLLDDLVDAHLLEEPGAQRYRFHDLIRQCAREIGGGPAGSPAAIGDGGRRGRAQGDSAEVGAALDRLTDFYLHTLTADAWLLEVLDGPISPARRASARPALPDTAAARAWYAREATNIMSVFELAITRERDETVVGFALVIGAFLGRLGAMAEWRRLVVEGARAAERVGDRAALAVLLRYRAIASHFLGRLAEAASEFEAARALAVELGDAEGQIVALRRLANVAVDRGDFAKALDCARLAEEVPGAEGFPVSVGHARVIAASALLPLGRVEEAESLLSAALALAAEHGDEFLQTLGLRILGQARLATGDGEAALAAFEEAAAISTRHGHESHVAISRSGVAEALGRLGRYAEALDMHEAVVRWVRESGEIHRETYMRLAFGQTCMEVGDRDRAAEQFRRCLELAEPHGFRYVAQRAAALAEAIAGSHEADHRTL